MTKWDYIRMISKRGAPYGTDGGVLDLLQWCGKPNTAAVTEDEARAFWEAFGDAPGPADARAKDDAPVSAQSPRTSV